MKHFRLSLLLLGMILGTVLLIGCGNKKAESETSVSSSQEEPETEEPPVCGGVTDKTDYEAPKAIESKEITAFYTKFVICDIYDINGGSVEHSFELKKQDGTWMLIGGYDMEYTCAVDEEVVEYVQSVIDKYSLASLNGTNKVTAGLPPEYSPYTLEVLYASGESLSVYENGDPFTEWQMELTEYFRRVFADAGFTEVMPSKDDTQIISFDLQFDVDGEVYGYGLFSDENENTFIYRERYTDEEDGEYRFEITPLTEEIMAELQNIVEETGLAYLTNPGSYVDSNARTVMRFYVNYESGRILALEVDSDHDDENWQEIRDRFMTYLNQLPAEAY